MVARARKRAFMIAQSQNLHERTGNLISDRKAIPLKTRIKMKQQRRNVGGTVVDARNKILSKKRQTITDARDKLAQLAKTRDARDKLTQIREQKATGGLVKSIGGNLLMKKDRNGRISLSTKKSIQQKVDNHKVASSTLAMIQKQLAEANLGRNTTSKSRPRAAGTKKLLNNRKVIKNAPLNYIRVIDPMSVAVAETIPYVPTMPIQPPVITRTIRNDIVDDYFSARRRPIHSEIESHWAKSSSFRSDLPDVISVEERMSLQRARDSRRIQRPTYIDLDAVEDVEMAPAAPIRQTVMRSTAPSTHSTGVRSRLDTPSSKTQSQGLFSRVSAPSVAEPEGHRIVVSNLHVGVTQEDITELFADIGDLFVARLVRPGTAEVIYKKLTDAEKAVEVYHNRQLDGQPMKCLLVNQRNANLSSVASFKSSTTPLSTIHASSGVRKTVVSAQEKAKLTPDLSTIHKVLFSRN